MFPPLQKRFPRPATRQHVAGKHPDAERQAVLRVLEGGRHALYAAYRRV